MDLQQINSKIAAILFSQPPNYAKQQSSLAITF